MDATKPYKFIGFGAMDATKPYKFIGCDVWFRIIPWDSFLERGRRADGEIAGGTVLLR